MRLMHCTAVRVGGGETRVERREWKDERKTWVARCTAVRDRIRGGERRERVGDGCCAAVRWRATERERAALSRMGEASDPQKAGL